MSSKDFRLSKQGTAGKPMTLMISRTLKVIRRLESDESHSVFMVACKVLS